eukprot:180367-Pelagomonas_calceolata.AAC.7
MPCQTRITAYIKAALVQGILLAAQLQQHHMLIIRSSRGGVKSMRAWAESGSPWPALTAALGREEFRTSTKQRTKEERSPKGTFNPSFMIRKGALLGVNTI